MVKSTHKLLALFCTLTFLLSLLIPYCTFPASASIFNGRSSEFRIDSVTLASPTSITMAYTVVKGSTLGHSGFWVHISGRGDYNQFDKPLSDAVGAHSITITIGYELGSGESVSVQVWEKDTFAYGTGDMNAFVSSGEVTGPYTPSSGGGESTTTSLSGRDCSLQARAIDSHSVELTWTALSKAKSYKLAANRTGDNLGLSSKRERHVEDITGTSYTFTDLTDGELWYFSICPVPKSSSYTGLWPNKSYQPTAQTPALSTPVLTAQDITATSVNLKWDAIPYATQYTLYMKEGTTVSCTSSTKQGDYTGTGVIRGGLVTGTTYAFKLKVTDGYNTETSTVFTVTPQKSKCDKPTISSVTGKSSTSMQISWSSVTGAASYDIYYSTSSSSPGTKLTNTSSTSYTATGLTPGSTYYAWVKAIGNSNYEDSDWSEYRSVTLGKDKIGTPSPYILSKDQNSITVSWSSVTNAGRYGVYYSTSSSGPGSSTSPDFTVTGTSKTITGLSMGTTYNIWVKAIPSSSTYDDSDWSSKVSGTTDTIIQLSGLNPYEISKDVDSIRFGWSSVTNATGYKVRLDSGSEYSVSGTSYTWSGLSANTSYYCYVKAVTNKTGYSDSDWEYVRITTKAIVPLTVSTPTAVTVSPTTSSIKVSWSSVSYASSYVLQMATNTSFSGASEYTLSSTSKTITGLTHNTTYYFRIMAKTTTKGYSDSGWSGRVSCKTDQIPLGKPTLSTSSGAKTIDSGSIQVTFDGVSGATKYELQYSTNSSFSNAVTIQITS